MNGLEIYNHLVQIIEQVNSVIAEFISMDFLSLEVQKTGASIDSLGVEEEDKVKFDEDEVEKVENETLFSPEKLNVAFASAYDCWAFNLLGFA